MLVHCLEAENFRNLSPLTLVPEPGVNIICGENAQGKTNLLEALWLFSGLRSFRGAKDSELVAFGKPFARLQLQFSAGERTQKAAITIEKQRKAILNGVPLPTAAKLMGRFSVSVFSPAFLALVQDGPAERRRFLDAAICQSKPAYAAILTAYTRTLKQRNSLLPDIAYHPELTELLDVWDEKLVSCAQEVIRERKAYLDELYPAAAAIYKGLSAGKEELTLQYTEKNGELPFAARLQKNRREDIFTKTTGVGPHRDDIGIAINGIAARSFGSQGQQRSCAIAMKLGEAELLNRTCGEQPVILLDDVMSELDAGRQDYILNHLEGRQVFITCCDPSQIDRLCRGKTFCMERGVLV